LDQAESSEISQTRASASSNIATVLVIDGMNLFLRHFAANPTLSLQGNPMGGVVGMMRAIGTLCDRFLPTTVIVVWEGGGSSRRRHIYPDYKAKRRPVRLNRFHSGNIPDTVGNRDDQVRAIVGCLRSTGIMQLYVEDCEADDVIAYISTKHVCGDVKTVIVSSDKDYYQLLSDDVVIYNPGTKSMVTRDDVIEKYGITPVNFALAKAMCGDISDNVKGVKGVQFKTAVRRFPLLAEADVHDVVDVVEHAHMLIKAGSKLKVYSSIVASEKKLQLNMRLVALDGSMLDADQCRRIDYQFDSFEPIRNKLDFIRTLIELGLNTAFNVDMFFRSTSVVTRR
jgi:5'-3' exonuclease